MNVTKRSAVLLLGIMAILVMVSVQPVDAAVNEYKADSWTDSAIEWTDDALAYDGDWGTAAYDLGVAGGDDYPSNYASGFDSANSGTGTITQLDIVVRLSVSGLTGSSDWWQLTLDVGASTDNALSGSPMYDQVLTNLTYTDVTEPNGGGWSWSEIWSAQIHFDTEKIGGADNADVYIYEYSFKITTSAAGTDYTVYPDGDLTLTGSPSLIADFVKTLADGFALAGTTSLFGAFAKTLIEGFTLAGTTNIFVIIQKIIVEGFTLAGDTSLVANFSVLLIAGFTLAGATSLIASFSVRIVSGFTLGGSVSLAVAYVKSLVEGFSLAGTITAFKVLIVNLADSFSFGVGVDILKIVGTSLIGSMFFQLFFGLSMWSYLGPIGVVILGYFVAKMDRGLAVLMFVVESLIIANYLTLVSATPAYWWHTFILLIGCILTLMYSVGDR